MDDADLVHRINDDPICRMPALEEFFRRAGLLEFGMARRHFNPGYRRSLSRDEQEEVIAKAQTRIFRQIEREGRISYDPERASPRTYMRKIVNNLACSLVESRARFTALPGEEQSEDADPAYSPPASIPGLITPCDEMGHLELIDREPLLERARALVGRLSERYQRLIHAWCTDDFTGFETLTPGALRVATCRARKELRRLAAEEGLLELAA